MSYDCDVAVIGTGTSAYTLAHLVAKGGKRVVMIDERPFGGTCAMRGCQPKKFLVAAAEAVERAAAMRESGYSGAPGIDWLALQEAKDAFTNAVPGRTKKGFRDAGMETLGGHARFLGPDRLAVGEGRLRAEHIVVATGAMPRPLGIPGEELLATHEHFLSMPRVPPRIVFVGGGYVSFEFAHVAARAGAEVTILQRGPRVLRQFDAELTALLVEASEEAGIEVVTDACVDRIEPRNDGLGAVCEEQPDVSPTADLVVHGAGRVPNLDGLGLAAGEVEAGPRGITVDEHLRSTTNPAVYAIGDAAATPYQLATTADHEGEVAARNILEGPTHTPDYSVVPSAVFTLPPLATVGRTEEQARAEGLAFRVNRGDMTRWPSSLRIGQRHAAYRVLVEEGTEKILGAHLLAHGAGDVINVFAMAMKFGLSTSDLRSVLWSYPTHVSDLKYML